MQSRLSCGSFIALAFLVACGGNSSSAAAPRFWAVGGSETASFPFGVVARSDDGGFEWHEIFTGSSPTGSASAVAFVDRENGWVVAGEGILHTTDGGDSFELQNPNERCGGAAVASIDAHRAAVVGLVCQPSDFLCLRPIGCAIHTVDGGAHWLPSDTTRIAQGPINDVCFTSAGIGLAAASGVPETADQPFPRVALSLDAGASWTAVQQEGVGGYRVACSGPRDLWAVAASPRPRVWHSADGGTTWTDLAEALAGSFPYLIDFVDSKNGWLIDGSEDSGRMPTVIHTRDAGNQWRVHPIRGDTGAGEEVELDAEAFATARSGVVVGLQFGMPNHPVAFATKDGGSTWSEVYLPPGVRAVDVTGVP